MFHCLSRASPSRRTYYIFEQAIREDMADTDQTLTAAFFNLQLNMFMNLFLITTALSTFLVLKSIFWPAARHY